MPRQVTLIVRSGRSGISTRQCACARGSGVGIFGIHRVEYVGMSPYLLGKRMISLDGDHPIPPVLEGLSPSPVLVSAGSILMVWAINKDTDPGVLTRA
jgi:hypothetical protein